MKRVMVVAGEMSGDHHAARLIRAIRDYNPDIEFFGIGGAAMAKEGVKIEVDAKQMAVLGFSEVFAKIGFFLKIFKQMVKRLQDEKPDALLLVDYPGFNLRLAKKAKVMGIKVIYYIGPQVWAWNKGRIPKMVKIIDRLMVILPFEKAVFSGTSLRVSFVGNPLVQSIENFQKNTPAEPFWPGEDFVAILPGSRKQEIRRILPVMLDTAAEILKRKPDTRFVVAAASDESAVLIDEQMSRLPDTMRSHFKVGNRNMREIVRQAIAAMVCSGTATVETGLLNCPMIVVYRATTFTYFVGRRLIKVKWLGMVNLVADETLCPEFIQHEADPVAMADTLLPLMADTPERRRQLAGLEQVRKDLAGEGAAENPAAVFWSELNA